MKTDAPLVRLFDYFDFFDNDSVCPAVPNTGGRVNYVHAAQFVQQIVRAGGG